MIIEHTQKYYRYINNIFKDIHKDTITENITDNDIDEVDIKLSLIYKNSNLFTVEKYNYTKKKYISILLL